jgi:hypothetical protein
MSRAQGHQLALGGSLVAAPFNRGAEMDAKTIRGLVFLSVLSLFCSAVAWAVEHAVFSSVFAALSAVAAFSAAAPRPRR